VCSASSVFVSFKQPTVRCNPTLSSDQAALFIAAMGNGYFPAVEVGTLAFCARGSSTPLYSAFSNGTGGISGVAVKPGDIINAGIGWNGHSSGVGYNLKDVTTGQSSSDTGSSGGTASVACVVASALETGNKIPLAQFSTGSFGKDYTGTHGTCYFGQEPAGAAPQTIMYVMINNAGTSIEAKPSALSTDLSSFKVTWKSAGP
jgi:hypothetical protein